MPEAAEEIALCQSSFISRYDLADTGIEVTEVLESLNIAEDQFVQVDLGSTEGPDEEIDEDGEGDDSGADYIRG